MNEKESNALTVAMGEAYVELMNETQGLEPPEPDRMMDCGDGKVQDILCYPDPALRRPTEEAAFDDDLRKLVADLAATFYASNAKGISAPQIGVSKRVFLVDILNSAPPKEGRPASQLLIAVNPKLWVMPGRLVGGSEGCLSFPKATLGIVRPDQIVLKAFTRQGKPFVMGCAADLARVIQHEFDHLNGKLLIDYLDKKQARDFSRWWKSQPFRPRRPVVRP